MSDEALQLVTFRLGNEEFGIDIKKVQEINRMIDITRIPNAPAYVEGVVNLRGKIIPIVSLRTKLGLGEADRDKATRIMVVEVEGSDPRLHRRFGLGGAQDTGSQDRGSAQHHGQQRFRVHRRRYQFGGQDTDTP